jgi:N,N-dimethylformamidase
VKIVGYADRLSVAPGEQVRFMVSAEVPRYRAELVRLIHGDENPAGPGYTEEPIPSPIDGEYPGRVQRYPMGSAVVVPDAPPLRGLASVTLAAWIWPTTPAKGPQGIVNKWSEPERAGWALVIDEGGELALWLGRGDGEVQRLRSGRPMRARGWYFVAASYDAASGRALLVQQASPSWPLDESSTVLEVALASHALAVPPSGLVMAATWAGVDEFRKAQLSRHFNGKIEAPALFGAALDRPALDALRDGAAPGDLGQRLVAAWDFALDSHNDAIRDTGPRGLHGRALNMPARAMTGHAYRGGETDWRRAPGEYGAIHFHDDDLTDAGWDADLVLTVPDGLRSGIYAAKLSGDGGAEDHIPFYVRPADRRATAPALFLAPTNSYLAYANIHASEDPVFRHALGTDFDYPVHERDRYIVRHRLHSLYDHHDDHSGVCYSSRLRPILNFRPKAVHASLDEGRGGVHQFPADLHLLDWLEAQGFRYDVATDEDLHREGLGLLDQYRVVLTGSHPEYWTGEMLDALEAYQHRGGRFMYLGGNGLYWVTTYPESGPEVIEVRRWGGTQSWTAVPGEYHHSTTGELGGLWRERQRAPQKYGGVGFTAQGNGRGRPYLRTPASFDPRAAWIFEGVGPDEVIGDFGLVLGAAGGYEVDRADVSLGTPPHALVVAVATGFSDLYPHVVEEVVQADSMQGGTVNPLVRGEVVFYELPAGGAVFATGSISWCGSLSHDGYANNVSRVTENVLRRFLDPRPVM